MKTDDEWYNSLRAYFMHIIFCNELPVIFQLLLFEIQFILFPSECFVFCILNTVYKLKCNNFKLQIILKTFYMYFICINNIYIILIISVQNGQ